MKNNWQKTVAAILMLVVMIVFTIIAIYSLFAGYVAGGLLGLTLSASWVLAIWGDVKDKLAEENSGDKKEKEENE